MSAERPQVKTSTPARESDEAAFEATLAGVRLPSEPPAALDETVVPNELDSWSSFGAIGPLPSIVVRFPDAGGEEAELELLDVLGEGGMGRVYRATQRSLAREVAVKTVKEVESPRAAASLYDEAVVTGRLSHPSVIPVHALGRTTDGRPMLVMKRVEGVGWNILIRDSRHAFWSKNDVAEDDRLLFHVEVLRKVAHAVAFAHSHGIVHRDIKPENVMLGDFGEVYLVDWGIAARTGTNTEGKLAGTPSYLAPEMVDGVVDERTDVYLLGATLHEILTGAPPHRGETLHAVLFSAFVSAPPTFGDNVPGELGGLAVRALARDPAERPPSAEAFGEALDDYVRHRGSRAIARTGEERLVALRRAIEGVSPADRDLAEVRRLVAECRFAFREARRGWAENPAVSPGLDACVRLALRFEIDRRDAEAARALLRELESPDTHLAEEVDQLEEELAREAEERTRLEKLARDLDPRIESGVRVTAAIVVIAMVAAFGVYVSSIDHVGPVHTFWLGIGLMLTLAGLLVVLWRRIIRNAFNKRLAGWVAIASVTIVLHRFIAMYDASSTVHGILIRDLVILGGFWATGSLFFFRWMAWVGLFLVLCTIPVLAFPSSTPTIFSVANALAAAGFVLGWLREQPSATE